MSCFHSSEFNQWLGSTRPRHYVWTKLVDGTRKKNIKWHVHSKRKIWCWKHTAMTWNVLLISETSFGSFPVVTVLTFQWVPHIYFQTALLPCFSFPISFLPFPVRSCSIFPALPSCCSSRSMLRLQVLIKHPCLKWLDDYPNQLPLRCNLSTDPCLSSICSPVPALPVKCHIAPSVQPHGGWVHIIYPK